MTRSPDVEPVRSPTGEHIARETLVVALGLAALFALVLLLSDGAILFTRPLWVDEVWTVLVSDQSSPVDVFAALSQGADGGSGLVHLSIWALQRIVGLPSPVLLRTLSLICVFTALCITYAVLRRRFSNDASIAGMLAVGSHYLVVSHSYEARFYGPWLLCCALLALAFSRNQGPTASRRSAAFVAVASVLVCTAHFYGVISLVLMAGGVVASHGRQWRTGMLVVAPSAAGLVAVLAIIPMAIGMRGAFSVRTWVPDFESRQFIAFARRFWLSPVLVITAIALVVGIILSWKRTTRPSVSSLAGHAARDAGIAALASLILMPLALTALTLVGQPAMLSRYAITTALAWGPLVALTVEMLGRWPALVARVVLVIYWFASYETVTFEKSLFARDVEEAETAVRRVEDERIPIVFQSVHTYYPVWARNRSRSPALGFLELSDSTIRRLFRPGTRNELYNRGVVIDRDVVRIHSKRFGVPRLVSQESLDSTQRFVLIAVPAHLPVGFRSIERFSRSVFPNHRVRQLDFNSALLERMPGPP